MVEEKPTNTGTPGTTKSWGNVQRTAQSLYQEPHRTSPMGQGVGFSSFPPGILHGEGVSLQHMGETQISYPIPFWDDTHFTIPQSIHIQRKTQIPRLPMKKRKWTTLKVRSVER